ncbi:carbohydrate-binding module family 13 protein [Lactarius psammicola]|nr:carbohydrate-binding module family 13 protein [Lactarius psammicola]
MANSALLDPSWFSHSSISIKSGQRYKIINEQTKLVLDLNGGDRKSILGYTSHGGENQQWITEKQVNGQWTIRSVWRQKYLGVETTPYNGIQLVGLDKPQFWDIDILPGCDAAKPSVKLCQWVNSTCFVADFPLERLAVGTNLQVCTARGGKNQVWVLEAY